ncbi:MAG: nucleoside-triphosphatase [Bacteroidales bacterium]
MNKHEINEKWIKASIIGTTWAASEIVLGSFLHNLRIPFSSLLLTAIGTIILISMSYVWKEKGLFWRAGLICALMKTMSPSAVIFGPMIAIFSQAMMLELSVRLLGRTMVGFALGAVLAMSWNLFQKIANMVLFYGVNIVDVYADLLKYAQLKLNIQSDIVWLPILVLLGIYSLSGLLAGIIGIKAGIKIKQQPARPYTKTAKPQQATSAGGNQNFSYSIFWLFLNLSFIVTALLLLNATPWFVWSGAVLLIAFVWILRYKRALRRLSKPGFWVSFVLITMLTAFVFNRMQSASLVNGLIIGLQMNFRAVIIVLGFSVLGTELYNPKIREFFMRSSMKQLPLALELSFKSLPMMIAYLPDSKTIIKKPVGVVYQIISQIEFRLHEIKSQFNNKVFIVTGTIGEGKTTQIEKIVETLKNKNIAIGGIFSPRIMENGTTTGYDVVDIATNERTAFLRTSEDKRLPKIGRYSILSKGIKRGHKALKNSQKQHRVVVIDEVGRLELDDAGWAEHLHYLLSDSKCSVILSVRDRFMEEVIDKWFLKDYTVLPVSGNDYLTNSEIIARHLN